MEPPEHASCSVQNRCTKKRDHKRVAQRDCPGDPWPYRRYGYLALWMVNPESAAPMSQPSPLPLSFSETRPLVIAATWPEFTAPACALAVAYVPMIWLMSVTLLNSPWPSVSLYFPTVRPPPFASRWTFIDCPLLQVTVPVPSAVL